MEFGFFAAVFVGLFFSVVVTFVEPTKNIIAFPTIGIYVGIGFNLVKSLNNLLEFNRSGE